VLECLKLNKIIRLLLSENLTLKRFMHTVPLLVGIEDQYVSLGSLRRECKFGVFKEVHLFAVFGDFGKSRAFSAHECQDHRSCSSGSQR
jgi:hypothetical protein